MGTYFNYDGNSRSVEAESTPAAPADRRDAATNW
jgi:hypothetical protein